MSMIVWAMIPSNSSSDEAPRNDNLSWEDAVEEAGKWIGTLHLARRLDGKSIDLTEAAKTLPFEGRFREMTQAHRRQLPRPQFGRRVSGPDETPVLAGDRAAVDQVV